LNGKLGPSKWWWIGTIVILGSAAVLSLWPVLSAPIAADDRYWFIETPARFESSYTNVIVGSWQDMPAFFRAGRVTPLAFLVRRLFLLTIFQFGVVTSTSIVVFHGIAKLILLALGVAACLTLLRALRWASDEGAVRPVGPGTLVVVGVALTALLAAGAQAHSQFRNGWISYPVLTYGAVIVVFGSAALAVTMARRVAERRKASVPVAVFVTVVLAAILNWTYELYYVGVPLSLFVLFAFPLVSRAQAREQRRARLIVGGLLLGVFAVGFAWTRIYVAGICAANDCYAGTALSLRFQLVRTFWFNVASSVPGTSGRQFLADLSSVDASHLWPGAAGGQLWLVTIALAGSTWLVWRWADSRWPPEPEKVGPEARLLSFAGGAVLAVGLLGALVMALSEQAQELFQTIGLPYRHTVLTWTAMAFSLALFARAFRLSRGGPSRNVAAASLVALVILGASSFTLSRNVASTQAYRNSPANRAIADIHWEAVAGDQHQLGDERRCVAFERAEAAVNNPWLTQRLQPAANELFERMHDAPFCSKWSPNGIEE
jgi:hypothetical protein